MYHNSDKIQYIDIITSSLSNDTGVKVKASTSWRADIKDKVLEYDSNNLLKYPFQVIKGLLLHEIGHINYTQDDTSKTELERLYPEAMHHLYNAFEDLRMEHRLIVRYGSYAKNALNITNGYFAELNLSTDIGKRIPKLLQFLQICMMYEESQTYSAVKDVVNWKTSNILSQGKGGFDTEVISRFNTAINNNRQFHELINSMKWGFPSFEELKTALNRIVYPIIEDYIKDYKQPVQNGKKSAPSLDKKDSKPRLDFKSRVIKNVASYGMDRVSEAEAKLLLSPYIGVLTARIQSILQDRKATRYTGNHKRGVLLNKNVFKVATGDNLAFSKRVTNDKPDKYRFYILIDASGSMEYLARDTILACHLINIVAKKLDLPVKNISFIEAESTAVLSRLDDYEVGNGGTEDIEALRIIDKDIRSNKVNNEEAIIIEITDGLIYSTDERDTLKNKLQSENIFFGIGIGKNVESKYLSDNFKNYLHVSDVSQLPTQLLLLMKKTITR